MTMVYENTNGCIRNYEYRKQINKKIRIFVPIRNFVGLPVN